MWPGNDAARVALPAKRAWKMSPGSVDEVELVQLKACIEGVTLHEPPGGFGGSGGSLKTVSISSRTAWYLAS